MKTLSLWAVAAFILAFIFTGGACATEQDGTPIKVGVVLPLTGPHAPFGEIQKNSFLMGLEEVNRGGGVNGRPIEILIEDDASKPEIGRSAVDKLITRDKAIIITGGYSSAVTYSLAATAQERNVPFLVISAAADDITEKGWDRVFRLNQPVSEYAGALLSFLKEAVKPQTAVILHESTLFGQSGSADFAAQAEKAGIRVLMKQGYDAGSLDFKPILLSVKAAKPDVVYMISYLKDAVRLMSQAREVDLNPKLFAGGAAGFALPEFGKTAGEAARNVYSTALWIPSVPYPGAREYYDRYLKKFGTPPSYHGAQAYAAIQVIADTLKRAKEPTSAAVREALAETDTMTVFGPVKFVSYDKKSRQNRLPTYMVQWLGGQLETVWPKDAARKPYVFPVPPWKIRD